MIFAGLPRVQPGEDSGLVVSTLGEDTWPQSSTQGGDGAS